jgi:hypothetical protein
MHYIILGEGERNIFVLAGEDYEETDSGIGCSQEANQEDSGS